MLIKYLFEKYKKKLLILYPYLNYWAMKMDQNGL